MFAAAVVADQTLSLTVQSQLSFAASRHGKRRVPPGAFFCTCSLTVSVAPLTRGALMNCWKNFAEPLKAKFAEAECLFKMHIRPQRLQLPCLSDVKSQPLFWRLPGRRRQGRGGKVNRLFLLLFEHFIDEKKPSEEQGTALYPRHTQGPEVNFYLRRHNLKRGRSFDVGLGSRLALSTEFI